MIKQAYNYLDMSIQEISGFFESRVENLETPAPPTAIRSLTRKIPIKGKPSPLRKTKFPQTTRNLQARKKFCQYHGKCSHSTDKCTTLNALIKKAKSSKSKGYGKGGKKTYTKYEVNILIEKKLKKTFKGRKKRKQEPHTFVKVEVSGSDDSDQSLDDSDASSKSNDS